MVPASSEWQAAGLRAKPFYWIVTVVMALAGGGLAGLYFGDKADAVVALHVGLSTPLICKADDDGGADARRQGRRPEPPQVLRVVARRNAVCLRR